MRAWRAANREASNAYMREWRANNREHARELAAKGHAKWVAANPEKAREVDRQASRRWREKNPNNAHHIYALQRSGARYRGIAFLLTFDEWMSIWQESGHWERRGGGRNDYCMARFGDNGPYAADNVKICTNAENFAEHYEGRRGKPLSDATRRRISNAAKRRY